MTHHGRSWKINVRQVTSGEVANGFEHDVPSLPKYCKPKDVGTPVQSTQSRLEHPHQTVDRYGEQSLRTKIQLINGFEKYHDCKLTRIQQLKIFDESST